MIFLYLLESFPFKKESDKGNIVDDYNKIKFFINVLK